ncbi:amidase signature enzyme [Meredithblackwellia eburnea MCA 4105]
MLGLGVPQWQRLRDTKLAQRNERLLIGENIWREAKGVSPETVSSSLPLEPEAFDIISSTSIQIVDGIKKGRWTSTQVLLVFIQRSLEVNEHTDALTEPMYAEALKRAKGLDEHFEKTGELVGPLHGVPCTFKDCYNVTGFDSAIGFTHAINNEAKANAALVKLILDAGGVPFAKTNVPQTMLSFECGNPISRTNNPYAKDRLPGGSTGGEAALLGADGTVIGLGTDIGGSVRIPAHYSGCFGIKPCDGRLVIDGVVPGNAGFEAVRGCAGPMARSIDDLEAALRVLINGSAALARKFPVLPVPYREVKLPKKLKIGYYLSDGFCRTSPACQRAVLETVEALRKRGHDVVEFTPPNLFECMRLFVGLTSAGGYQTLLSGLKGDPMEPSLFLSTMGPRLNWFLRKVVYVLYKYVLRDNKLVEFFNASRTKTVTEMQAWQKQRTDYVKEFREEVWGRLELDAIIAPTQAVPALKHGETSRLSPLALATIVYNVVESSAGVVPVTFVDPIKDALPTNFLEIGDPGSKLVEAQLYGPRGAYNSEEMAGLPVGVQVIGAGWEEEKVIELMREVDTALGPRGFSPGDYTKKFRMTEGSTDKL